jgi:hypothetical protein
MASIYKHMDPVAVGALLTSAVALVAACIARTRCFMRVLPTGEERVYEFQAGCGFTDAVLVPNESRLETHVLQDNEIIFTRK